MPAMDWIRILILSLVWGSSFLLMEIALRESGPLTITFARSFLAMIPLHLYAALRGRTISYTPRLVGSFLIMGFFANALPFFLIALGQTRIESGLAAILIATTPILTVVLGHLWGRTEAATAMKFAGVLVGFTGVTLLIGIDALTGLGSSPAGQAALLGAALCHAVSALYGRRFTDLPVAATTASMLTASTLYALPLAFLFETPFAPMPGLAGLSALAAISLSSTALAYMLYFQILASSGATNAMLVTLVQPPLAVFLGMYFLGERLELHQLAGLSFILGGLLLIDGRLPRRIMSSFGKAMPRESAGGPG